MSHFKDRGAKTQTIGNTQGHVPIKWESWYVNLSLAAKSGFITALDPLVLPVFAILYNQKYDSFQRRFYKNA